MDRSIIVKAVNDSTEAAVGSQQEIIQNIINSDKDEHSKIAELIASDRTFTQKLLVETLVKLLDQV